MSTYLSVAYRFCDPADEQLSANIGIPQVTEKELVDLLDANVLLESKAAYLAASRRLSSDAIGELWQIYDSLVSLSTVREQQDGTSSDALRDISMQIHLMIAKFSGNAILYKNIAEIRTKIRSYSHQTKPQYYSHFVNTWFCHLLKAIENRDAAQAEMWMRCITENARYVYRDIYLE